MEIWLFDLGNSRLKAARLHAGAPTDVFAMAWEQPGFIAALAERLQAWPAPVRVLVASVAGDARARAFADAWPQGSAARVEWIRSRREACGVRNRYAVPERFGIDRFLALVALREVHGAGVVIGCGTALTLDGLAADGLHAAGLIAASPEAMLAQMRASTAIADGNPDAFPASGADVDDDTARALHDGCWAAAGALVRWFHARQGAGLPLCLHGGWAAALAAWLAREGQPTEILEHAVLRGLAVWALRSP